MSDWVEVEFDRVVLDDDSFEAVLFMIEAHKIWIPRSQLRDGEYDCSTRLGSGTFEIPRWLAEKQDLV